MKKLRSFRLIQRRALAPGRLGGAGAGWAIATLVLPLCTLQCGGSRAEADGAGGTDGAGLSAGGQVGSGGAVAGTGGRTSTGGQASTGGQVGGGGVGDGAGGQVSSGAQAMGGEGGALPGAGGQLGEAGGQANVGGSPAGGGAACDLLAQDCSGRQSCVPTALGAQCVTPPENPLGPLEQCEEPSACGAGFFCRTLTAGSSGLCMEVCDTTTSSQPCGGVMSCMPLDTLPQLVDHPDAGVGLCTPCSSPDCDHLFPGGCATDDDCSGVASLFGHKYRCEATVCVIDL